MAPLPEYSTYLGYFSKFVKWRCFPIKQGNVYATIAKLLQIYEGEGLQHGKVMFDINCSKPLPIIIFSESILFFVVVLLYICTYFKLFNL